MMTETNDDLTKRLHKMSVEIANFIALFEDSDLKLKNRQHEIEEHLSNYRKITDEQLQRINTALNDISEVMTAAGAARWRVAAEQALEEAQTNTKQFQDTIKQFQTHSSSTVERLHHIGTELDKRIAKMLSALSIEQEDIIEKFRKRAEDSYKNIDDVSKSSLKTLKTLMGKIRLERIGITIGAAVLASFLTSLYINAEWPWESFHRSHQEKVIGKTILTVWPTLTKEEQQQVKNIVGLESKGAP